MVRQLARLVSISNRVLNRKILVPAAGLLGKVEPLKRPISSTIGKIPMGSRVVVFCHFHPRGRLQEHVRRYISAFIEENLSIVFVTNSGRLDSEAINWLQPRCAYIIIRHNAGFDFAAWRDALVVADLPNNETELLIIANDSVYGPLSSLEPLLARMNFGVADVWALTDSWQWRFHLQSYLVAFGPRALRHAAFCSFWKRVRDLRSKEAVVQAYEIGLTQALLDAGLRCEALWPYIDTLAQLHAAQQPEVARTNALNEVQQQAEQRILAAAARRVPLNPTAELWRLLLIAGFPFLKRELLRSNPACVPDVAAWLELARSISPDDAEVILRDLRNSLRKSAP
jgi:hypothetical protein